MTSITPPPEWYLRAVARRALQGRPVVLPFELDPEPSNVVSIAAARTRKATAQMMRERGL